MPEIADVPALLVYTTEDVGSSTLRRPVTEAAGAPAHVAKQDPRSPQQ